MISSLTYTGSNVVLVKYDGSGVSQWAQTVAGNDQSAFSSVSAASDGSVYAAGYIYGTGTYNFGNITVAGTHTGSNIVLVKYNSNGVAQWAQTVAGNNVSSFSSVSVASDGSVYAAGNIYGTGTYDFGNGVTATGPTNGPNLVLVKYSSSTGLAQWARTVAGSNESSFNGVSVASDGLSVYAAGYIAGTGTFDFGNSVISAGTYTNGGSVVLVKYDSSSGLAQWAQTVTAGPGDSFFTSVSAVASDGSVYAAGYIQGNGTYNFGNITAAGTSSGGINMVLVKYDSSGVAQWARTVTAEVLIRKSLGVSVASMALCTPRDISMELTPLTSATA
jgi:hypothetical protein